MDNPQSSALAEEPYKQDALIAHLQERIRKIKRDPRMEGQYMLFREMLSDERKEGRMEGRAEGEMLLLKLMEVMQADGLAAEIPRLGTDPEFREAMYSRYELRKGSEV